MKSLRVHWVTITPNIVAATVAVHDVLNNPEFQADIDHHPDDDSIRRVPLTAGRAGPHLIARARGKRIEAEYRPG